MPPDAPENKPPSPSAASPPACERQRWSALPLCLVIAFLPALTGFLAGPGAWYGSLQKPAWNPPSWVFGPVWTLLYLMIGIALWRLWCAGGRRWSGASSALAIFAGQLLLNGLWTPCFFGLHAIGLALVVIVLLWLAIIATIVSAWRHSRLAACLLVPYGLWVSFAAFLNFTLWRLNP